MAIRLKQEKNEGFYRQRGHYLTDSGGKRGEDGGRGGGKNGEDMR